MKAHVRLNMKKVKRAADDGTFRSLKHASGAVRLTAKRSIRRSKKPSRPGTPPHTPTGALKRVLRYDVDQEQQEAAIGAVNEYARTIWNLHEFGGATRRRAKPLKAHKFQVGDYGPIRRTGSMQRDRRGRFVRRSKTFARVLLLTEAQARRATRIVELENAYRQAEARKTRFYPARPFMGPALQVNRKRLPLFWENSIHA